jgi:chromosome segregation ATPase
MQRSREVEKKSKSIDEIEELLEADERKKSELLMEEKAKKEKRSKLQKEIIHLKEKVSPYKVEIIELMRQIGEIESSVKEPERLNAVAEKSKTLRVTELKRKKAVLDDLIV